VLLKSANHREAQPSDSKQLPPEAEFRSRLSWFLGVSDPAAVDPSALTYEPYFGLREKPFGLAADPRFFFTGLGHGIAFDALAAGIRRREGILVLTGLVGTGKTTLCRAVLQSLDRKTFAAYVSDPFLSREDLLKTLLVDFGVVSAEEVRRGALRGTTRADLCYPLYDFLESLVALKAFAVVMIDEAQNLPPELLEEVRILSDLERGQKLLQVFLIGQPELDTRLADEAMRPLAQRVTITSELPPLTRDEIGLYIAHRLAVAGNDGRVRFTDAAIEEVRAASGGIPRLVNIVCDRALTNAASLHTSTVDVESVKSGAVDRKEIPAALAPALSLVHSQPDRPPQLEAPPVDLAKDADPPAPDSLVEVLSAVTTVPTPAPPPTEPQFWSSNTEARAEPDAPRRSEPAKPAGRSGLLVATVALILVAALLAYRFMSPAPAPVSPAPTTPAATAPTAQPAPTPPPAAPAAQGPAQSQSARPLASEPPQPAAPVANGAAPVPATRFALLMATFEGNERTEKSLEELRTAGFKAFRVEVSLHDGGAAQVVYVGPYTDRAEAERDLERARDLPGYDGARLVTLKPTVR
jgi:type II secretory pathway predicted ATPase ExeA/cell division septation protein DedD